LGEPEPIDHAGDDGGDLLDVGDRRPGPTRQLGRHHPIALCGETPGDRRHLGRPTAPAVKSENEWVSIRWSPVDRGFSVTGPCPGTGGRRVPPTRSPCAPTRLARTRPNHGSREMRSPCRRTVLVELTGFEPVTTSLRTRCSARLSYSPLRETRFYPGCRSRPPGAISWR